MMPLAGEIWLAEIFFTNAASSKIRPVLILWVDGVDAVVAAVTSAAPRTETDYALLDWKSAGLRVASTIRLSRLDTLELALMRKKLGIISAQDSKALKTIWQSKIQLGF